MTTISPPKRTEKPLEDSVGRRESGRFRTTPGRLRLLSIVSVAAIVILLIVSAGALSSRRSAAKSVADESGARLVQVQALYHALADADANASRQLLAAGVIPTKVRRQYLDDLAEAGRLLVKIAEHKESSPEARRALAVIAEQLPQYSEKVESARVQSRFGYPIGAQQMREASTLMRTDLLGATLELYKSAAGELHDDYDRGTSASQMVWITVIGLATLVVLIGTQIYTARRTNRVLNIGLLAASLIVAVLLVWSLVSFNNEQNALIRAQRDGSDSLQVLSSARILALQSQANANLALAERGTGQTYRAEFARLMKELCGDEQCRGGLLDYAHELAGHTRSEGTMTAIQDDAAGFWSTANEVVELDTDAKYNAAVTLALADQASASTTLDTSIATASAHAQSRFEDAAGDARSGFEVLAIVLTLGMLLAAVLALVGLQPRIKEYQ